MIMRKKVYKYISLRNANFQAVNLSEISGKLNDYRIEVYISLESSPKRNHKKKLSFLKTYSYII